jgi:uncharacterized membrane protein
MSSLHKLVATNRTIFFLSQLTALLAVFFTLSVIISSPGDAFGLTILLSLNAAILAAISIPLFIRSLANTAIVPSPMQVASAAGISVLLGLLLSLPSALLSGWMTSTIVFYPATLMATWLIPCLMEFRENSSRYEFTDEQRQTRNRTMICYLLMITGLFTGVLWFLGGIWIMLTRSKARNHGFYTHHGNMVKTFWYSTGAVILIMTVDMILDNFTGFFSFSDFLNLAVLFWAGKRLIVGLGLLCQNAECEV